MREERGEMSVESWERKAGRVRVWEVGGGKKGPMLEGLASWPNKEIYCC